MGKVKTLMELNLDLEPCPTHFKTKKESELFFRKQKVSALKEEQIKMSNKKLFDNEDDWLYEEPWRRW